MDKEDCSQCKDLPEGEVIKGHDHRRYINGTCSICHQEAELHDNICESCEVKGNVNFNPEPDEGSQNN